MVGIPPDCGQGEVFTYEKHGFVAIAYELSTDQYGTQLDPPAHWETERRRRLYFNAFFLKTYTAPEPVSFTYSFLLKSA